MSISPFRQIKVSAVFDDKDLHYLLGFGYDIDLKIHPLKQTSLYIVTVTGDLGAVKNFMRHVNKKYALEQPWADKLRFKFHWGEFGETENVLQKLAWKINYVQYKAEIAAERENYGYL